MIAATSPTVRGYYRRTLGRRRDRYRRLARLGTGAQLSLGYGQDKAEKSIGAAEWR